MSEDQNKKTQIDLKARKHGKSRDNLDRILDGLTASGYWGKVTITYKKGVPIIIDKNEEIKLVD